MVRRCAQNNDAVLSFNQKTLNESKILPDYLLCAATPLADSQDWVMLYPMRKFCHTPFLISFICLPLLLPLAGCYGVPVEPAAYDEILPVPPDATPSPVRLGPVNLALPRGDTIGSASPRGLGILCRGPYGMITRAAVAKHIDGSGMRDSFYDTMKAIGYDVTGSPSLMFDEEEDEMRTLYRVGARIVDIKMDVCQRTTLLFAYDLGYTGEASMDVEWTVYDRLKRERVYKTTTRGYSRMELPNYEAIGLMLDDSFGAAAHNLGADEKFHALVVRGTRPHEDGLERSEPVYGPVTTFDPRETVYIPAQKLRTVNMGHGDIDRARHVAVQVSAGTGHGSGFFISEKGHILTNHHVVGDASQVRVVTADGAYKLMAEVLRRDRARDVALLRVTQMPAGFRPTLLPIRTAFPAVGEDIYTVGAPRLEKLQDTVTKGIVSAIRTPDRADPYNFIQGDVFIYSGNSGGPLIDGRGNIIGIAVSGYTAQGGTPAGGLNLFIPIGDALRKLGIAEPAQ